MPHVGQWCIYNWFDEHGMHLVHPDDIDDFRQFKPQGHVMQCIAEDAGYLILQYGKSRFRVKPDLFTPIPTPQHHIGQVVSIRKGTNIVVGTVCDIEWHFNRNKPYYLVIVEGKRSGMRYWDEDFEIDEL